MAENIDKRIIIVEIEVPGGKKRLEGLSCDFTVTKTAGSLMNEAEIRIANLARADRDYIVTATSPLRRPRRRKSITVWAGYASTGVTRRFSGDITDSSVTQPPDIWLSVKAKTGYHARGDLVARTAPAQANLSQLAGNVAKDLGLELDFQATDKSVSNYSFTGGNLIQVDRLARAGLVDAYVDDDRLIIKDRGKALAGRVRKLCEATGMIGIPEVDERGVRVKMFMDQHTGLGTMLEIESTLNPAANGNFVIYKMRDNCSMRGLPFYIEAEASKPGLGGMVK